MLQCATVRLLSWCLVKDEVIVLIGSTRGTMFVVSLHTVQTAPVYAQMIWSLDIISAGEKLSVSEVESIHLGKNILHNFCVNVSKEELFSQRTSLIHSHVSVAGVRLASLPRAVSINDSKIQLFNDNTLKVIYGPNACVSDA